MRTVRVGEDSLYRVDEAVGTGPHSAVWRATRDGERVALKVFEPPSTAPADCHRWFRRDVTSHAALRHPGIVKVFDFGRIEAADVDREIPANSPFLATEFADLGSVRQLIPAPNWEVFESTILAVLDALAFAHARGIFHRDLKPENILFFTTSDETVRVKLADFGIRDTAARIDCRERSEAASSDTTYLAAEQMRDDCRLLGPWTDIYALGVVAFEMVCGEPPTWTEDDELAYFDPRIPVPKGLRGWIDRATRTRPRNRFSRAADAVWELIQLSDDDNETSSPTSEPTEAGKPAVDKSMGGPADSIASTVLPVGTDQPVVLNDFVEFSSERCGIVEMGLEGEGLDAERPGLPGSWRGALAEFDLLRNWFRGPALTRIGEVPFVGRGAARDRLWEIAKRVERTGEARFVVIEGDSGTGKTRIARWLLRRLHELGIFSVLDTAHAIEDAPGMGLKRLLSSHFRTRGLNRTEIIDHLEAHFSDLTGGLDAPDGRSRSYYRRLAEYLAHSELKDGSSTPVKSGAGSREEEFALSWNVLEGLAEERPLVVLLDDLQWGIETAEFIDFGRRTGRGDVPILFVATFRAVGEVAPEVDSVVEDERTLRMELSPLQGDDQDALVDRLLPVQLGVSKMVKRVAKGNPLHTIQTIEEWLEEDLLFEDRDQFVLDPTASRPVPATLFELWEWRIERMLRSFDEEQRDSARQAIELAATMGIDVHYELWSIVVERKGIDCLGDVMDELASRGFIEWNAKGFRLLHDSLVVALRRSAKSNGRWQSHNRLYAEVISPEVDEERPDAAVRLARFWREAGEPHRAVEPLLRAVEESWDRRDISQMTRLLEERRDLVEETDRDRTILWRVENWSYQARAAIAEGRVETARGLADRAEEIAAGSGDARARGEALSAAGLVDRYERRSLPALERLREAERCFAASGDEIGHARCKYQRAIELAYTGRLEEAVKEMEAASRLFRDANRPVDDLGAKRWIASFFVLDGRFSEGASLARATLHDARKRGATVVRLRAHNTLGEAARYRGRWDEALRHYRRVIEGWRELGQTADIYRINLAFAEIGAGDFESARSRLRPIASKLQKRDRRHRLFRVRLGLLACAAGLEDWEAWDDIWAVVTEDEETLLEELDVDRDDHWSAELGANITARKGEVERAGHVFRLSAILEQNFASQ